MFANISIQLDTRLSCSFPSSLMHANNTRDVNHSLLVDCIRCHQVGVGRRSVSEADDFFAFCRNCLELPLSIIFVGIGVQTDPVGRELGCDLGGTAGMWLENDYKSRKIDCKVALPSNEQRDVCCNGVATSRQLQDFKFLRELTKRHPRDLEVSWGRRRRCRAFLLNPFHDTVIQTIVVWCHLMLFMC